MPRPIEDPILAYTAAEGAINQVTKGTLKNLHDVIDACCRKLNKKIIFCDYIFLDK